MINNISEGALRVATKIDPSSVIHEKEAYQQTSNEVREARPVEQAGEGTKTETRDAKKDESSSKFLQENKTMVFEKYDKNGDLVLRIPPSTYASG